MKTIRSACKLQPNALDINVGDQIERFDEIIKDTDGKEYFDKTFITDGMKTLLSRGIARLAGKSNDSVFHLKQAMGGGKTHLMVGFGLLAKNPSLREVKIGYTAYQADFSTVKIAASEARMANQTQRGWRKAIYCALSDGKNIKISPKIKPKIKKDKKDDSVNSSIFDFIEKGDI